MDGLVRGVDLKFVSGFQMQFIAQFLRNNDPSSLINGDRGRHNAILPFQMVFTLNPKNSGP